MGRSRQRIENIPDQYYDATKLGVTQNIVGPIQLFVSPLPSFEISCHHKRMKLVVAIQRLLCVIAMFGVLIGPMSISTAESAMASIGTSSAVEMPGMDMTANTATMTEMPCCPEQKQTTHGCPKNCPLALVCASMLLVQAHEQGSTPIDFRWVKSFVFFPASSMTSAAIEPPARPPRV